MDMHVLCGLAFRNLLLYAKYPVCKDQRLYKGIGRLMKKWPIESTQLQSIVISFTVSFIVLSLSCPSSPRVWFNLYRFVLKSGRLSSTKARGSLLLCSESIRSSSRKHGDYPGVARQFCVPTESFAYKRGNVQ
jgi:hypothetical protein